METYETELQKQVMDLAYQIIELGCPESLLSKFERIAVLRGFEIAKNKNRPKLGTMH